MSTPVEFLLNAFIVGHLANIEKEKVLELWYLSNFEDCSDEVVEGYFAVSNSDTWESYHVSGSEDAQPPEFPQTPAVVRILNPTPHPPPR
jgi:hypothetical protein